MTAIGVIPARGASQRLPGKNVMMVGGSPLIAHTIRAARSARRLDAVIVSTDDDAIAKVASKEGAQVIWRPAELARVDSAIDDTMRHVVDEGERHGKAQVGIVVCMQANVPVRKEGEIDSVVERLTENPSATSVATAYRVRERPEWMKRLKPGTWEIEAFMDAGVSYRMQDLPNLYLLDGAIVAVRVDTLRKTTGDRRVHAYMGPRVVIVEHERKYSAEIDDIEDVGLVNFFLSQNAQQ